MLPRERYKKVNSFHNLRHITHDYGLKGVTDSVVYKRAVKESRMIVVFNTKDFRPLRTGSTPTIFALSPNLSNEQVDLKLFSQLRKVRPSETKGCLFSVTKLGVKLLKQVRK